MQYGSYKVCREVNACVAFKGLKGQWLYYMAGGTVATIILFAVAYSIGVNQYICTGIALSLLGSVWLMAVRLSKRFGQHGMMKMIAKRKMPAAIRARTRRIFIPVDDLRQHF